VILPKSLFLLLAAFLVEVWHTAQWHTTYTMHMFSLGENVVTWRQPNLQQGKICLNKNQTAFPQKKKTA
jgi:hypothetical protein